jgi:hypothetical protein
MAEIPYTIRLDMFKREACNPASSIACGEDQEEPQGVAIAFD